MERRSIAVCVGGYWTLWVVEVTREHKTQYEKMGVVWPMTEIPAGWGDVCYFLGTFSFPPGIQFSTGVGLKKWWFYMATLCSWCGKNLSAFLSRGKTFT
jgi:hypothetical protein